jgi:hypothetical protein
VAGTFAAVLSGTMLAAAVPAANAAPGAHRAHATPSTVVYRTCQNRAGGVRTCEWLWETLHRNINGTYSLNIQAYGSMNGNVNKAILQVQTWGRRWINTPPHEIAVLPGPSGSGYIQGFDGQRLCSGGIAGGVEAAFTYKYFLPKPVNAWITGTAWGAWQYLPPPC